MITAPILPEQKTATTGQTSDRLGAGPQSGSFDSPICGVCGTEKGSVGSKYRCSSCHRESLAKDRRKHGGAASRNKRWEADNRLAALAHKKVESHLRSGNIVKRPCERCGDPNTHAHHDDYRIPLEIRWLCPLHHKERHRELDALGLSPSSLAKSSQAEETRPAMAPFLPAVAGRNSSGVA